MYLRDTQIQLLMEMVPQNHIKEFKIKYILIKMFFRPT